MNLKKLAIYGCLGLSAAIGTYSTFVHAVNKHNRNLAEEVSKIVYDNGVIFVTGNGKKIMSNRQIEIGNLTIYENTENIEIKIVRMLGEESLKRSDYIDIKKKGNIKIAKDYYFSNGAIDENINRYENEEYMPFYPDQFEYIWILTKIKNNDFTAIKERYKDIKKPKLKKLPKDMLSV